ncbi:hypothetical protein LJC57_04335 [Parabacteroides sp. OttesenSCG-928-G07]|nr:hypothetical protein [Parabacteroides sp. OttesenSCG-928-G21]MDL2277801.1 hypothetical protein [Parabacteroides sp. OttesenSCG-928-G07]
MRERVYLQTDKQTYLAGELLWMKLYLTDAEGKPSPLSKVGYVELLDAESVQVQVKLDISEGTGEGWLELPITLPTGYYRLVAYSRYMQNEGDEVFFQKNIGVINTFLIDKTVEIDNSLTEPTFSVLDNTLSVIMANSRTKPRTENSIQIQGLPEDVHSLAISVAGKDLVQDGSVLNISQWQDQLPATITTTTTAIRSDFLPEYEGHIINAKLINVATGQPETTEKVSSLLGFVGEDIRLFDGVSDNQGNVQYVTKRITGRQELATATFPQSENKFRVDIQSPFAVHPKADLPTFKLNSAWEQQLLQRSVGLQVLYSYMADSLSIMERTTPHFQWKPYSSYILDNYTRFTRMDEVVIEFVTLLSFRNIDRKRQLHLFIEKNVGRGAGSTLALLDGIPITDHNILYNYDPLLVQRIELYRERFDFNGQFFDGLVSFTTYANNYPTLQLDESTQIFDYEGTQARRLFYAPSYKNEAERNSRTPDYRHTLLWIPEVDTHGNSSVTIPFSTSDLTGEFQVVIEGLTKDGKPLRGITYFDVE